MAKILILFPTQSLNLAPTIRAGRDIYDHIAVFIQPAKPLINMLYPSFNTDPASTSSNPKLQHGIYSLVKGVHRWRNPGKEMPGFFVTHRLSDNENMIRWQNLHGSDKRKDLPCINRDGTPTTLSYINVHSGGVGPNSSDWSEGCLTTPSDDLLRLYNTWTDLPHGYLVYAASADEGFSLAKSLV